MARILNITNGDSAVDIMLQAKIPGIFLPWRDVLHDGPVPEGLSLQALSQLRAKFIAQRGWGDAEQIQKDFTERDNVLKNFEQYDRVILWFEHDLYDQLQLIQILDWFNFNNPQQLPLSIICTDQYLGTLSAQQLSSLFEFEIPVTQHHLDLSSKAWSAFRASTPLEWQALLETDTSPLPFLQGAIIRMLQEYPACENGLSRTARQALTIVGQNVTHPGQVFAASQQAEQRVFLGDSSFWEILNEMLASTPSLLKLAEGTEIKRPVIPNQKLSITAAGKAVLANELNWLDIFPTDRWIGGVHLTQDALWCWNEAEGCVVAKG
jgi:hypothetical protein